MTENRCRKSAFTLARLHEQLIGRTIEGSFIGNPKQRLLVLFAAGGAGQLMASPKVSISPKIHVFIHTASTEADTRLWR
jgi:hypothetical protein